jgi:hypothetical protein
MPQVPERATVAAELELRSSKDWDDYFAQNDRELLCIPWEDGASVTDRETAAIASSIQGFQLGESSEGFHLSKCGKFYSEQANDPAYFDAIKRFIREEQRHARELARFMDLAGIPTVKKTWPDTVFRKLRHFANLEVSISVLITAEIIAKVYYPALREATESPVLRTLCDQIIQDEAPHVEFQAQRLAILRQNCGGIRLRLRHGLHRFLFFGTCLVVWQKHGKAIKAGGLGFRSFWQTCWREFVLARRLMDPTTY